MRKQMETFPSPRASNERVVRKKIYFVEFRLIF